MIKIICDVCKKEPNDKNFVFEATKAEIIETYDVLGADLNPKKTMDKKMYQICRACFEKHFKKLLN